MMQWIRWQGLLAFLLVVGVLAGIWFLVIDGVIERAIEQTGTKLVGARVDLEAADLSLFPLGLTLTGLHVTNPDSPMTNAVQAERISFLVDPGPLLRRKVIIENMAVEGVQFNRPRATSGAVKTKEAGPGTDEATAPALPFTLPPVSVPSVQEILQKEELQSLKRIEALRQEIQTEQETWEKRLADLPNQAKLTEYKARVEKLKSAGQGGLGGILGGANEVVAIQKDVQADLQQIQTAKADLEQRIAGLRRDLEAVAKAPAEDLKRLKAKYAFTSEGLSNLSGALLQGPLREWIQTGLHWYRKVGPLVERQAARMSEQKAARVVKPLRGKGVDVRFPERAPLPNFLIRNTRVLVEIPSGTFTGTITNITPEQPVLGTPLTFAFDGENLKGLRSAKVSGELNRVDPASSRDSLRLAVREYRVKDLSLSSNADWPLALKNASADVDLDARLAGEAMDAMVAADLRSVTLTSEGQKDPGPVGKALKAALADIKQTRVKATITGTTKDYQLQLTSDLDRVLKNAVGKQVQSQLAGLERDLRGAIAKQVDKPLADLRASLSGLGGLDNELTARTGQLRNLLTSLPKAQGGLKLPF